MLFTVAELGQFAEQGVTMVARWCLCGEGSFSTVRDSWNPHALNNKTYTTSADYWVMLAHKATVGTAVLKTAVVPSPSSDAPALVYSYCGQHGNGSVVLAVSNPSSKNVSVAVQDGLAVGPRYEYVFTFPNDNMSSTTPVLNGRSATPLEISKDGSLPTAFAPHFVAADGERSTIVVPPRSAAYYVILHAAAPACTTTTTTTIGATRRARVDDERGSSVDDNAARDDAESAQAVGETIRTGTATMSTSSVSSGSVCDVSAPPFNAKNDNETDSTVAIQAALTNVNCTVVLIPSGGAFLAKSLYISSEMSNRVLNISKGAELGIWRDPMSYGSHNAFLNAPSPLSNFTLGGGGTIRGGGVLWWALCRKDPM